jgi:hypothetical protein
MYNLAVFIDTFEHGYLTSRGITYVGGENKGINELLRAFLTSWSSYSKQEAYKAELLKDVPKTIDLLVNYYGLSVLFQLNDKFILLSKGAKSIKLSPSQLSWLEDHLNISPADPVKIIPSLEKPAFSVKTNADVALFGMYKTKKTWVKSDVPKAQKAENPAVKAKTERPTVKAKVERPAVKAKEKVGSKDIFGI